MCIALMLGSGQIAHIPPVGPGLGMLGTLDAGICWACGSHSAARVMQKLPRMVAPIRLLFCRNRKTGFKCPRGCGKGTRYEEPCRGKVWPATVPHA